MKKAGQLSTARLAVVIASLVLFGSWLVPHFHELVRTQDGIIRFSLTLFFSALIIFRRKQSAQEHDDAETPGPQEETTGQRAFIDSHASTVAIIAGGMGVAVMVSGIVLPIRQLEWIGLLLLLFACLLWALPDRFKGNVFPSMLLLYWAHPLPTRFFDALQATMQEMSVTWSEWFMHMVNIRVWADGLILRTGLNTYEIPMECSGMRTATTVFLLALGLGIIKRLRWFEYPAIVGAALLQALALNVLRITVMVTMVPKVDEGSGIVFLHDTAGIIVILAVLLVYLEIRLLDRARTRRAALLRELTHDVSKSFSRYPPFWRVVIGHRGALGLLVSLVVLSAGLAYKSRPYHTAEMIKDVALSLRNAGRPDDAQRAADLVCRLVPKDDEWKLTAIRLLVVRARYKEALDRLAHLPDGNEMRIMEKKVLRAYSFMAIDKIEQAEAIVQSLPEDVRRTDPRVAMILAELGCYHDNINEVKKNLAVSSRARSNLPRIRALYPYLRIYKEWASIVNTDSSLQYDNIQQALSAVEACMNLGQSPKVADITISAIERWPDDPRLLEPLFFMTVRRMDSEWEDRFARHLARCASSMDDPDALYGLVGKCFGLGRPDLSWLVFNRIQQIDPSHPLLFMIVTRFGDSWFSFRKRFLGFTSMNGEERVDLKQVYSLGGQFALWRSMCTQVPLGDELAAADTVPFRKKALNKALAEFRKRDAAGQLSVAMQYEFVSALEIAKDFAGVRRQLAELTTARPDEKDRSVMALSEIYQRKGDWQNVYETLRDYMDGTNPQVLPVLRLCAAQMNLRLGLAAIHSAQLGVSKAPYSTQAISGLATALAMFDSPEEALFVLEQPRIREEQALNILTAETLFKTQRFKKAQEYCRSMRLPPISIPENTKQSLVLPAAEMATAWHLVSIPSERDFAANAAVLKRNVPTATSPFLRDMMRLWLECYEKKCAGNSADPARWLACGRNNIEKALALNQLTVLLCRNEKYADARNAAKTATELFPQSGILWRILISLSGSSPKAIVSAREACPDDPEVWLAEIVARRKGSEVGSQPARIAAQSAAGGRPEVREREEKRYEEWVTEEMTTAASNQTYSAATMVRAAEYLLRTGLPKPAAIAARDATARADGLLPAYITGIKCAVREVDRAWALECTRNAVAASLDPVPGLYVKLVQLKSTGDTIDTDSEMVQSLKNLRVEEPGNPLWAQMLGYVRFQRGGWETIDAIYQMNSAVEGGATNTASYILAAEASRLLGNNERAVDLLRQGLKQHPNNLAMLNNLIYTLSETTNGIAEAVELLPKLVRRGGGDMSILDTETVTYIRSGQFNKAVNVIADVLRSSPKGSPTWFRARLQLADIAVRRDKKKEALSILDEILKFTRGVPDADVLSATTLRVKAGGEEGRGQKPEVGGQKSTVGGVTNRTE